jgi:hypothetical protein
MRAMSLAARGAACLLILTALPACDNVGWGGSSVHVVSPPPPGGGPAEAPDPGASASFGLPAGSVLFHVIRGGEAGARIVPVAEIVGDSLRMLMRPADVSPEAFEERFRATLLEPNAQFELFRRGARVGTFTVQGDGPVTACGVPTAVGFASTVAAAAAEPEFLAFRRGLSPAGVLGEFSQPQVDAPMRRYASLIAERQVLQNGLPRPRSWPGAQRDLQALDVERGGHAEMAATYLVGDQLEVGPAEPQGYAVFYMARYETRTGYTPFYTDVRRYEEVGQGAPRLVDHVDWNDSGRQNVLIEVLGRDQSWYEGVSGGEGNDWRRTFQGQACR